VQVLPFTTTHRGLVRHGEVVDGQGGLRGTSFVMRNQIPTVPEDRFRHQAGQCDAAAINRAIAVVILIVQRPRR